MILDEAQNTTITQMKMFLTRMGHHSKIVVTGDGTQTDLPDRVESGLNDAVRRLKNIPGIATVFLSGEDIVRHPLVRKIVAAYDDRRHRRFDPWGENSATGDAERQEANGHKTNGNHSSDSELPPSIKTSIDDQTQKIDEPSRPISDTD